MADSQLAVRIDSRVRRVLRTFTRARGLKVSRFVEDAIIDKLEEYEDIDDLKTLRRETTRPLKELIRELGLTRDL
ncbi:MAG: hypothetical protein HYY84_17045 [Deltaproteobacteria bacterium]|nr:hypothetical protein [Deltaproteobacteria bacterium]